MNAFLIEAAWDVVLWARSMARGGRARRLPPFDPWWLVDIAISVLQVR